MNVNPLQSAQMGLNSATALMNRTANNIAQGSDDLATDAVNQIVAEKSFSANAAMFGSYDEMMGELIAMADHRKASMD